MKNQNLKWGIGLGVVIVLLLAAMWYGSHPKSAYGDLDGFAQCIASKGITMYGAYWCPHCQDQKKLFGDSFKYVPYVECTEETDKCLAANIEGYPTWIFPDGSKVAGLQSLEELASKSGCELPVKTD